MSKIFHDDKFLMFEISSPSLKPLNSSTILEFELNSYDESFPIYQIVLDFINSMGGIN